MEFSVSLDYLTITGKHSVVWDTTLNWQQIALDVLKSKLRTMGVETFGEWKTGVKNPFYQFTFTNVPMRVEVFMSFDGQGQGWMVRLSGEALRRQSNPADIVQRAVVAGFSVTRIDIALDFLNCEETALTLYDQYEKSEHEGRKRTVQIIHSQTGNTFYIGSRSSDKMVRCYDKGAKEGLDVNWLRVELELKGDTARLNAARIADDPRAAAAIIVEMIGETDGCVADQIRQYAAGAELELQTTLKPAPDRVRWLRTQVLAAFKALAHDDPDAAADVLNDFMLALRDEAHHLSNTNT